MTRMQNMFAETNALLSEIKAGLGAFNEQGKYMRGVETDPHDIIGFNLFMSGLNGNIPSEMDEVGYEDCFFVDGVSLVEWADIIEELLPPDSVRVTIRRDNSLGFDYRRIEIDDNTGN